MVRDAFDSLVLGVSCAVALLFLGSITESVRRSTQHLQDIKLSGIALETSMRDRARACGRCLCGY